MVDWQNPEVVQRTMFVFVRIVYFLFGVYSWYLLTSFHKVELGLLLRRTRLQLAHVPYLAARYSHLITLITTIATTPMEEPLTPSLPTSCSGLGAMRLISVTGDLALTAANCNLAMRAVALWKHNRRVSYILGGLCLVDCCYALTLGLSGVTVYFDSQHTSCSIGIDPHARIALLFFYIFTMCWGSTILTMTILGIRRRDLPADLPLSSALLSQGIGYVVTIIVTCIPMGVVSFLPLNQVMNVMFLPIGCTICVIASSASVTSLLKLKSQPDIRPPLSPNRASRQEELVSDSADKGQMNVFSTVMNVTEGRVTARLATEEV